MRSSTTGTSLPAGASASNLDAGKILAAIGDPSKLLDNTSVSSESVEGIDSDKVSGDVNMSALQLLPQSLQEHGQWHGTAPTRSRLTRPWRS